MNVESILITGSGGFIGKNLKNYLEGKYKIFAPRSFELNLLDENAVKDFLEKNRVDFILHCASIGGARGVEDAPKTLEHNLKMFENLILNRAEDTKIITFGSGAAYDKSRSLDKIFEKELGECIPEDLYGKSKLEIAKMAEKTQDVLCLNIFACYGKEEKETRFPTYAILKNLNKEEIIIENNAVFDYLFIEDLEKIVEHFILNWTSEKVINITPAKSTSMEKIAQSVNKISGYNVPIKLLNESKKHYTGSNSRLLAEIPDFEFTELEDGLQKLFSYVKN